MGYKDVRGNLKPERSQNWQGAGRTNRWKQLLDCPVFDRTVTRRRMAKSWLLRIGRKREVAASQRLLCNTHASGLSLSLSLSLTKLAKSETLQSVTGWKRKTSSKWQCKWGLPPFTSPFTRRFHPFYTKLQGPIPKLSHHCREIGAQRKPNTDKSSFWINRAFDLAYEYEQGSNSYIF